MGQALRADDLAHCEGISALHALHAHVALLHFALQAPPEFQLYTQNTCIFILYYLTFGGGILSIL